MHTNLLQSHPTLCNPTTLWTVAQPGSSVHGFLQARILEWVVAMLFFRGPSWPRDRIHVSFFSFIGRGGYLPLVPPGKPWIKLWKVKALVLVMPSSLQPHGLKPARFLCPWNSPVKESEAGTHSLLQHILPTQGSNLSLHTAGRFFTVWVAREAPN